MTRADDAAPPLAAAETEAYWSALVSTDTDAAYAVAADAVARGVPLAQVLHRLVVATQLRVGELWACNQLTVAQEHAVTAVSENVVRRLGDDEQRRDHPLEPLVVACVEREWHALPALVVAHTLQSWGHPMHYLGGNTSSARIAARVAEVRPRAVLLSASLSSSLPRVHRQIRACRALGIPVVVGGNAFDAAGRRARALGAQAVALDVAQVPAVLAGLPREVDEPPVPAAAATADLVLADADDLARRALDLTAAELGLDQQADVWSPDDWRVVLATFVPHVVDCVAGALLTDDPTVLTDMREWFDEVLGHRGGDPRAGAVLWESLATLLAAHPDAVAMLRG